MRSKNKTVTILGGNGYIGSHVAEIFSKKGYFVKVLDTKKPKNKKKNIRFFLGSILEKQKLKSAIKNANFVFNFAALADIDKASDKPYITAEVNVLGVINILNICKLLGVKKIIQASSIYANSEQGSFYGCSKKASEDFIERFYERYKLRYSILRFGSLYGGLIKNGSGLQKLIYQAKKQKKIKYSGTRNASREYIYINDAAEACYEMIKKKYDNKYLTLTGNQKIQIKKVVKIIKEKLNIKNKNIIFKNIQNNIHYEKNPKIYKPRKGIKFKLKKKQSFKKNLINLLN